MKNVMKLHKVTENKIKQYSIKYVVRLKRDIAKYLAYFKSQSFTSLEIYIKRLHLIYIRAV